MISVVQQFGEDLVQVDGRSVPVPSLVEDEFGDRWLLMAGPDGQTLHLSPSVWGTAAGAGAVGLVILSGPYYGLLLTEDFMRVRRENRMTALFEVDLEHFGIAPGFPELQGALEAAGDPGDWRHSSFVQLHLHSEFSQYDGLSTIDEAIDAALADGQTAIAVTDHGNCAAHPLFQARAREKGIHPIYGMEGYLVDDRHARGQEVRYAYHHLVLWAIDDEGLRNLWAISTEAHREGFYQVPRFDWDTLERLNKGLMASTACLSGPLSFHLNPNKQGADPQKAVINLGKLMQIFDDRLYIEIHANNLPEQRPVNEALVRMGRDYGVPLVAVADSHYARREDKGLHGFWYAMKNAKGVEDATESSFAGGADLHISTADEVRLALAYLDREAVEEAISNTSRVANRCTADVNTNVKGTPNFSKGPKATERDVERLRALCMSNWERKTKGAAKRFSQGDYRARFDREFDLLVEKAFCGYFLIVADYVMYAKDNGVLVGPGRGSGGGSLVAYLSDITEVDPVEAELLFERFLTKGRKALPDFDIDFPSSRSDFMAEYIRGKYGAECVAQVGTVGRLKNKGALRETARLLAQRSEYTVGQEMWRDVDAVSKIIDAAEAGSAGLGMTWEDLWTQHEEELGPFRAKWPEWIDYAEKLVGRVKNYGKHAAGIVISTEGPLTGWLPMRMGDDGVMVTQFDMEALELLGLVKFDFLKLRTLDTLQECIDMIESRYGVRPDVYHWTEEYDDPLVWTEISDGHTMGVFQIETSSGTRLTTEFKPQSLSEMSDILTLVRPGPMRSGLTRTYLNRRAGAEDIVLPDRRLEAALAKSYGCLLYQEDIMATTMLVAGYDGEQADKVRKILGKKQVEKVIEEGQKFLAGAVENGMDREAAQRLWHQMAEFAKYSFNRAHAYAYGVISYWCAWFKVNYPVEFLVACLSTVDSDRVPDFVQEARRIGYSVLPPDVNESGVGFRYAGDLVIRYGFLAINGVGEHAAPAIVGGQPYSSVDDFQERKVVNSGVTRTLVRVGAFDKLYPHRRALEALLEYEISGLSIRCQHRDDTAEGPNGLPCTFDWANEPQPPQEYGRTGKPLKLKVLTPPKKCTVRCRHYTRPNPLDTSTIEPYTEADIRDLEKELLGVYLSSTPFDRVDPEHLEICKTADELHAAPEGTYLVVAIVNRFKRAMTKTDKPMAFVTLDARTGEIDAPIFSESLEQYGSALNLGNLVMAEVKKRNDGRFNISAAMPI